MQFSKLATSLRKQDGRDPFVGSLLSLDPGKTTGFAIMQGYNLVTSGQLKTPDLGPSFPVFMNLIREYKIDICVVEDYRVYKSKVDQHAWSELHTAKLIGVLEGVCQCANDLESIPLIKQPAYVAKGFCTDKKLQEWQFYQVGQRHARDAIRHACYHILFGGVDKWHERKERKPTVG